MTMADGGYDPMGHIQTGRPHAYYLYQVAAAALEQHQQQQQQHQQQQHPQQQQQPERQQSTSPPNEPNERTEVPVPPVTTVAAATEQGSVEGPRSNAPSSDDGHENNNNLPATTNHNLFRSEQKKHKRKRLSAVLDKLHNGGGGAVVNHNNNNVGEGGIHGHFAVKCQTDSRSSAEDSAEDSVFPYSASPRISVSPLRLSEVDENRPGVQTNQQHGLDQQLPSPSQQHQAKLNALSPSHQPLQPAQIKQEVDQQMVYKQLQYLNPLTLFNSLNVSTKLFYQQIARQHNSHFDGKSPQPDQQQTEQTKQPVRQSQPKKKRANGGAGGRGAQKRPPTSSSRNSSTSSSGSQEHPQELPLDLSMKSGGGRPSVDSPTLSLSSTVIKKEPKQELESSPQPPASYSSQPGSPMPPALIVKREHFSHLQRSPAYEHHLNGGSGFPGHQGPTFAGMGGPGGFNLNVSPVVEEMPPGSDVAYMCPVCGQLFSLQDRLAKHMASRHKSRTGPTDITKSYMCEVCKRSFARSDMLTRHMRLHTGVKPYSCKVCGQIFSRSDHLSTHQRTHTGEKPYKCPQCPYAACRRDMITRHMRTHTRGTCFESSPRGSGGGGGGGSGESTSPLLDQKPLLMPLVSLGAGHLDIKKEVAGFGEVNPGFALVAKTES